MTPEQKKAAAERLAKARAAKKAKETAEKDTPETEINLSEVEKPNATAPKAQASEPNIVWFGEVDLNKKGVPSSDYPAYYFERQLEELNREIGEIERGFDLDMYSGKDKLRMREELSKRKTRRDAIEESRPKLRDGDKDVLAKTFKSLGERIGESMFTYSDMQRGTADAHVEANRMVNPCIEIKSQIEADYCKQRGIPVVDGKISRNHASQMCQLFGKVIGEGIVDMERFRNQR